MEIVTWVLFGMGAIGLYGGHLRFVSDVLPENLGRNPGFGAYESGMIPGWLLVCIALGLRTGSAMVGAVAFPVGLFLLGFVGQMASRAYRRKNG